MGRGPPRVWLVAETLALYASVGFRVGASIVFTIILARFLPVEEFAMYGVVASLSLLLSQPVQLWGFWASRRAVWEWDSPGGAGRTGLALTLAYGLLVFPLYALASLVESLVLGWSLGLLLAGYAYLGLNTLVVYTRLLASTIKPLGYAVSRTLFDVVRIGLAVLLVAVYRLGYLGAIASTAAAIAVSQAFMLAYLARLGAFAGRVDWGLARAWLSNWRVPGLQVAGDLLRYVPRPYVSLLTSSNLAVAYLNVGITGQSPLLQTAQMTQPALYARLLRGSPAARDVRVSLQLYTVFAGLLLGLFLYLARPLASLFNPEYIGAYWAIQLVAVYSLLLGAASIFRSVLVAIDQTDRDTLSEGPLMKKAMLLQVAATAAAYLLAAPAVRALRGDPGLSVAALLSALALSALLLLAYYARIASRHVRLEYPSRTIAVASVGLAAMGLALHTAGATKIVVGDVWGDGLRLAAYALLGGLVYMAVVAAGDPSARRLVSRLLRGRSSRQPL